MGISGQSRAGIRREIRVLALVGVAALGLAACSSGRNTEVAYNPQGFSAPDPVPVAAAAPQGPQRIAPLDKLRVSVFQVAELSGDYQVDTSGAITFPLIGLVEARGKTADELADFIAQRLGERYLRNPRVQVSITDIALVEQRITLDGAVRTPGLHPVRGPTSLLRAIALGGGTAENANPRNVVVFRTVNGQRMAAAFDLTAIRRAQAEDPTIYPEDIVIVDGGEGRTRGIVREVLSVIPILGIFNPF
jgi:polysaccharide export outer membrane protein